MEVGVTEVAVFVLGAVLGAVVGAVLTFLFNLRADKVRWARRVRLELYATAIRKMQILEDAAKDYRSALSSAATLEELLAERRDIDADDSRVQAMRDEHTGKQKEALNKVRTLRGDLARIQPEFEIVASPMMNIVLTIYLATAHTLGWNPHSEEGDFQLALDKYEKALSEIKRESKRFVDRAGKELGLPQERPLKGRLRSARAKSRKRYEGLRNRIVGVVRRD